MLVVISKYIWFRTTLKGNYSCHQLTTSVMWRLREATRRCICSPTGFALSLMSWQLEASQLMLCSMIDARLSVVFSHLLIIPSSVQASQFTIFPGGEKKAEFHVHTEKQVRLEFYVYQPLSLRIDDRKTKASKRKYTYFHFHKKSNISLRDLAGLSL